MKKVFFLSLILLLYYESNSQHTFGEGGLLPVNPSRSVLFGYDIYVNDQPDQDQQKVSICSAFNGWLFSAFSYFDEGGMAHITIFRSIDAGQSWEQFFDAGLGTYNKIFRKIKIVAGGQSTENLKIFLGGIFYDTIMFGDQLVVDRINGVSGIHEDYLISNTSGKINDFAMASDYPNTAITSNPFSLGVVYSYRGSGTIDSVVFYSSNDGGLSLNQRQVLATSITYLHKVGLSFGYSPTENTGRYFAVWEEQADQTSEFGHIFTSHSEPNFNSPFTTPVCLDCSDPDLLNKCRNPVISCISGDADNDSLNITEVILFENNNSPGNYDITGFYNRKAVGSNNFYRMNFAYTSGNEYQPDICYNPFDSSFIVTYFYQQNQKLPYLRSKHSLTDPHSWTLVSQGYNDNQNIVNPEPSVIVNYDKQSGAVVWNAERTDGNGAAMYDAEYLYYTGISENNQMDKALLFKIYPNPCSYTVTSEFEAQAKQNVSITLCDLLGRPIRLLCNQQFTNGRNKLESDLSDLSSGSYLCIMRIDDLIVSSKILLKQ